MDTFIALLWIGSIIAGVIIGSKKNEGCLSFIGCFFLGPIWLIVVILSKGNRVKCIWCQEYVDKKALFCPHCNREHPVIRR